MRNATLWAVLGVLMLNVMALAQGNDSIPLTQGLFIDRVTRGGRDLIRIDPVAQDLALGTFTPPKSGDVVRGPGGERAWAAGEADDKGRFDATLGRGGYGYFEVACAEARVMVLEARAHAMVYVGGEPRMGDPYASGAVAIPVHLHEGRNDLVFSMGGRSAFQGSLRPVRGPVELDARDLTTNDLVAGEESNIVWVGIVLRNCTDTPVTARLESRLIGDSQWTTIREIPLAPLLTTKPGLRVELDRIPVGDTFEIELRATATSLPGEDIAKVGVRVRQPGQVRKVHYNSMLDGSVQYFAVVPPQEGTPAENAAMVLSLHGASVEATSQAGSYAPKPGMWIVCPTNRRPFGFDWESFGREDALAVFNAATNRYKPDPTRIYLTGHSMGGHGSWQLATLFPDRFAAVAPSAGWISFESYAGGRNPQSPEGVDPIRAMLKAAAGTSDTLAQVRNLDSMGVFILHGDADDNVPVSEARAMGEALQAFHRDWRLHEEPGAGHWWDSGAWKDHAGAACVDYPPIFDFFARHRLPATSEIRRVDFTSPNPWVSGACAWATILTQEQRLRPSRVVLDFDPATRTVRGVTTNVSGLHLSAELRGPRDLTLVIDGTQLALTGEGPIFLRKHDNAWSVAEETAFPPIPPGSFVEAYAGFNFIYATGGSPEENAQSLAHARYDAEQWWVRGNGNARLLSDREYNAEEFPPSGVMLYGNADINLAWSRVILDPTIRVTRGKVEVAGRSFEGGVGVLTVQQGRDGSPVGIIAGTDLASARSLERLPLFVSGVGVPEIVLLKPDHLTQGDASILGVGLLGNDWSIERGELHFREPVEKP